MPWAAGRRISVPHAPRLKERYALAGPENQRHPPDVAECGDRDAVHPGRGFHLAAAGLGARAEERWGPWDRWSRFWRPHWLAATTSFATGGAIPLVNRRVPGTSACCAASTV